MSTNHTPGPWKVSTTYKLAERGAAEIVPWNDQGRTLALTQTVKGYSPDESIANARLIAAAPDLLRMLEQAMPYVEEGEQFNKASRRGLSKQIRAELAKHYPDAGY